MAALPPHSTCTTATGLQGGGGGNPFGNTRLLLLLHRLSLLPWHLLVHLQEGGGGNPFGNMGNLMENLKKAQAMVQVEAAKVQEELAK